MLSRRDPQTGEQRKREFGAWIVPVFRVLSRMRGLRGTAFDVFGYSVERKAERALIGRYEKTIETVLTTLEGLRLVPQYDAAVALAALPEQIRGYGHVRARSVEQAQAGEKGLLDALKRRVIPLAKAA